MVNESVAIIRGDNRDKVKIALHDLKNYAKVKFLSRSEDLEPEIADKVLVRVLNTPLKKPCGFAARVLVDGDAYTVVNRLRKIHPPAHIIVVDQSHEIYDEVR